MQYTAILNYTKFTPDFNFYQKRGSGRVIFSWIYSASAFSYLLVSSAISELPLDLSRPDGLAILGVFGYF